MRLAAIALMLVFWFSGCGGGGSSSTPASSPMPVETSAPGPVTEGCNSQATPSLTPAQGGPTAQPATGLTVSPPLHIDIIDKVPGARELAFAPNGDLFVGTSGSSVYIIANAEGQAATPHVFADLGDAPAAGVALSLQNCSLYVGTQFHVFRIPYTIGDQQAQSAPISIANLRKPSDSGDDNHTTTTVAVSGSMLYASVGSTCNACVESDPLRATIQQMQLDGGGMSAKAVRIRNAIALAVNPQTGTVWAGGAGQDDLPSGHPYEFLDAVTLHGGVADYGWPDCEENRTAYASGANCSNVVVPLVEFPAYETLIGAAFAKGGVYVTMHGSWHTPGGCNLPPRVAFVPMNGDVPQTSINWSNPAAQWRDVVTGFQPGCSASTRIGRPTGIAVGPQGDLFIGDDQTGNIYRVR